MNGATMKILLAMIGSVLLLAVAAFCAFGFLATFEPGDFMVFRVGYAVVGLGCVAGAIAIIAKAILR